MSKGLNLLSFTIRLLRVTQFKLWTPQLLLVDWPSKWTMSRQSRAHPGFCLASGFTESILSHFCHVRLFATPWTGAWQAPLSMRFFKQDCRSGLPFPSPGDCPDPGVKPWSLVFPPWVGEFLTTSVTWETPLFQLKAPQVFFREDEVVSFMGFPSIMSIKQWKVT